MIMNNYHTHTIFCDGKNTAEEMVKAAIKAGSKEIGFTGHSYLKDDPSWTMSPENERLYKEEIGRLKEKYKGKIDIYLGIEQDYMSSPAVGYEYILGSVHCLYKDGHYISLDDTPELLKEAIRLYYNNDPYALCEDYYETVSHLYEKTKCQIIGHFDLITKFNEKDFLIDTKNERYRKAAKKALYNLIDTPAVFEINYGAISRGYRSIPYPEPFILSILSGAGKPVILSSDAHSDKTLLYGFEEGERLIKEYNLNRLESFQEFS